MEFTQFWQSAEAFLNKGIGYIAVDGDEIIGHAFSAAACDSEVEIDLFTAKSHRGKGISTLLTKSLISKCIERDLTPKWDCAIGNNASIKLAHNSGFEILSEYPFSYITKE